jgi:hypothetical protein
MIQPGPTRPFGAKLPLRLRRLGHDDDGMSTVEYAMYWQRYHRSLPLTWANDAREQKPPAATTGGNWDR